MSTQTTFTVPTEGERADRYLASVLPDISRSGTLRLFDEGRVTCGGKPLKKSEKLAQGQIISVEIPPPAPLEAIPQDIPLDIVFEDSDVVVINKPVGMVVHPAAGHLDGTLVNALLYHCGDSLSGINGALRPGIVHRIDKDTSGLLIVAKNDHAHASLASQLQDRSLSRVYEAVCFGKMKHDEGTINAPIARHPHHRKRMAVIPDGREAITHYEVISPLKQHTHLRCHLETGRTHQIRVHLAHVGHPLVGDEIYGGKAHSALVGQCLHARELRFIHPSSGQPVSFSTPLPPAFEAVLKSYRLPL